MKQDKGEISHVYVENEVKKELKIR